MPKKCPVRPLQKSALTELGNYIVTAIAYSMQLVDPLDLNHSLIITMVEINSYLYENGATSDIYEDLLHAILSSDFVEASIRFTCLQMLLNESVSTLITEVFPFSYYERILQVIATHGSGLRTLNLKGVWVKDEHMKYMYEIVQRLIHINRLSIPYIANDDLLKEISKSLPKLKILDISGVTDITEIGVEYLCESLCRDRLTVLDIGVLGEENICHTDIALIILNFPNLINLKTYSFVGKALHNVRARCKPDFKSKLQYVHDTKTNSETLDAIVELCPDLESIYLDNPQIDILHKLKRSKLRRLKLHKFHSDELHGLLRGIGERLVHLTCIKGRGILDLGKVARNSSGLSYLDCYMMESLIYNSESKFTQLRGLEILNSPFSTAGELKRFISHNSKILRIAIDEVLFSDEDLLHIFIENNFIFLEDVWFTTAQNLTISSVELLMSRCPNLESIGQLSGWNLTPDDIAFLRGILKSENSSIVLSPTSLFP